jgi:hypothetical protein
VQHVARVDDAFQFAIGETDFICHSARPLRRLQVTAHRTLEQKFPVDAKTEEGSKGRKAFGFRPNPEFQAAVKCIDIGGLKLVQHDIATRVGEFHQLLGERAVFAKRCLRKLLTLAQGQEDGYRVNNPNAACLHVRRRFARMNHRSAGPRVGCLQDCGDRFRLFPFRVVAIAPLELSA